jgi:RNA polymerase sigma-70 factor, ECF subfamily
MTTHLAQLDVKAKTRDDLALVHASKCGNVAAFEQLVKRYDRKLLRIAQSVTHNIEDSQDAVQEDFLKAYQHLAEFREASQFSTWLIRITLNQSLMKLRKQRGVREVPLDEDFHADKDIVPIEITDWAPNPEQLYWASELRDILTQTLKEVRPSLRAVFVLRDIEGLSINLMRVDGTPSFERFPMIRVSEVARTARILSMETCLLCDTRHVELCLASQP